MQSAGRSLRHVSHVTRPLQTHTFASTSRGVSWLGKLGWRENLQKKIAAMAPKPREKLSSEEIEAAREKQREEGSESFFDAPPPPPDEPLATEEGNTSKVFQKKHTEHKYSTANFKISHRKLNMLGRQISGKPIDYAILQMQFSEKRASKRVKSMLVLAKQHAVNFKDLDPSKLVVSESWVTKGPNSHKRMEPRGRSHYGIRVHPDSKMSVVLREGKTFDEKKKKEREKKLRAIRSAGLVREDVPIRNPAPMWGW